MFTDKVQLYITEDSERETGNRYMFTGKVQQYLTEDSERETGNRYMFTGKVQQYLTEDSERETGNRYMFTDKVKQYLTEEWLEIDTCLLTKSNRTSSRSDWKSIQVYWQSQTVPHRGVYWQSPTVPNRGVYWQSPTAPHRGLWESGWKSTHVYLQRTTAQCIQELPQSIYSRRPQAQSIDTETRTQCAWKHGLREIRQMWIVKNHSSTSWRIQYNWQC